jgi:hypothetical protein
MSAAPEKKKVYKTGIYFLSRAGKVIYIGQTTRFPQRIVFHNQQCMPYDCVRLIQCDASVLDHYEQRWIRRFKPELNVRHKPVEKPKRIKVKAIQKFNRRMKFRKLSRKSIIGFGNYRDRTVGRMLEQGRQMDLASMYYKLSHISFLNDVLNEIGIVDEWVIQKPGVDPSKYGTFGNTFYPEAMERRKQNVELHHYKESIAFLKGQSARNGSKEYHKNFNQKS